jgi:hypothetical protein
VWQECVRREKDYIIEEEVRRSSGGELRLSLKTTHLKEVRVPESFLNPF